ncbi:hypothetical protein pb186bvf_012563 [Paramecium bursaria]
MQFNSAITEELRQNVKYKDLLSWGIHNGVLLDSVYLPAAFDDGLTGVVATQYIPPNKAIICVPYNLVISQEKCKESELKEIYLQNPQLFDEDESSDAEFNILIFYMYREKRRGKESFYYPYIEAIQAKNTLNEWTQQELEMIEDPHILQEFAVVKQDMLTLWNKAEQIIIANQDLFGQPSINDKEDFYWAAESVMSRCFGWSLKSTSMIPVADFLNHSNQACTHNMVHKIFEQNNEDFQKQYKIKKDKLDLSVLGLPKVLAQYNDNKGSYIRKNQQYLDEQIILDLQKEQKNIDNLKDDEKRYLINQINYNQLMRSQQQIWDLGFCTSTDSEDNDSDEEVEEAKQKQFQHLKQQEEQLVKARRKTHVQVILNECNQHKHLLEKQNSVKITGLTEQQLDMIKTVQQDKLKQFNQVQDAQSETSSEESQWDWLKEDDKDAYFAITSTSPIYKNQQVTVSYGRRTNRFLISWYGFALEFNKYSSYNFRLWLNTEIYKTIPISSKLFDLIVIQDVIQYEDFENGFIFKDFKIDIQQITKEFRLKRHKLNNDLIMYLRLYLMVFYDGPDLKEALITVPTFLDYEIFILQFSIKLFNYFMNKFSQSLEEDIRQLHQPIDYKRKFAIYINKERKEILMAQIMMTLDAIIILKKYKENQNLKESYLQEKDGKFKRNQGVLKLNI